MDEKLEDMVLPSNFTEKKCKDIAMGTMGNWISVSCFHGDDGSKSNVALTIWVLKEYGVNESWTKLIEIPLNHFPNRRVASIFPTAILENSEVLMSWHHGFTTTFVLYSPKEKTHRIVLELDHLNMFCTYVYRDFSFTSNCLIGC